MSEFCDAGSWPARMDAPGGPVCGCGRPSRHESGWCGLPQKCRHLVWSDCMPSVCSGCGQTEEEILKVGSETQRAERREAMSEELKQVVTLLEKVVETNQQVIRQNDQFLHFLEARDARIPERTALEIERLTNETQKYALELKVLQELGTSQEDIFREHFLGEQANAARVRRYARDLGEALGEFTEAARSRSRSGGRDRGDRVANDEAGGERPAIEGAGHTE